MRRFLIMSARMAAVVALLVVAIPALAGVVSCSGNGIPHPREVVEPNSLIFGDVYFGHEAFNTFTVTNGGNGILRGFVTKGELCSPWFTPFIEGEAEADSFWYALGPDEVQEYTVRFSPPADSAGVENPIPANCDILVRSELSLP